MAARLQEMAWVVSMLDYCPEVEALGLHVSTTTVEPAAGVYVGVVEVDLHARTWGDATRVAEALRLGEGPGRTSQSDDGIVMGWRTWTGWAPDGSQEMPVRVKVTAGERVADIEAVA